MLIRLKTAVACAIAAMRVAAATARAQPPGENEDLPRYEVQPSGVEMLKLGVPRPEGETTEAPAAPRVSNCLKTVKSTSAITSQTAILENH